MAAHESLGPQFFHGTDADLQVGDEIKPGNVAGHRKFTASEASGHGEFTWMSPHAGRAAFFGKHVYQVEPQGLTNEYNYGKAHGRNWGHPADMEAHVSLAPAKIIRKGTRHQPGIGSIDMLDPVKWEN
jgi:hypothetical protein